MRVAFDTSVLVAGAIEGHEHHARATVWLRAAREGQLRGCASTHAFAETWATLTALPLDPPVPTATASRIVTRLAQIVTPLELAWGDYELAIQRCGDRGARSGAVYDALHLVAAERAGASRLLTFNTRHFARLVESRTTRILAPPDPPAVTADE